MKKIFPTKKVAICAAVTVGATVLVSVIAIIVLSLDGSRKPTVTVPIATASSSSSETLPFRDPLTGEPTANATSSRPVAVMIENHVDARPLSGVSKASLVFEVPVEGGITRLMAVFDSAREVKEIGPVRSARAYYLDWADELDAMYVHVGGSPEALDKLKSLGLRDLNQFFWDEDFWRSGSRAAPHNVYTSTALLRGAMETRKWADAPQVSSWLFASASSTAVTSTSEIVVPFSTSSYTVRWRFDPLHGLYLRSVANAAASDKDGSRVSATNVGVAFVESAVVDEVGRLKLKTVGQGSAMMFRDGEVSLGTWEKASVGDRLRFYAADGSEFVWRPGATWIEIVPTGTEVTYTKDGASVAADGNN